MANPDEITGQHPLPQLGAPLVPTMLPPQPQSKIATMALAVALAVVGGAGSGYASSAARDAADDARAGQQITDLERRVAAVEAEVGGVEGVRRDLAALSATVTAQNAALAQRLQRIEDALDRSRR